MANVARHVIRHGSFGEKVWLAIKIATVSLEILPDFKPVVPENHNITFIITHPRSASTNMRKSIAMPGTTAFDSFFSPIWLKYLVKHSGLEDYIKRHEETNNIDGLHSDGHEVKLFSYVEEDFFVFNRFKGSGCVLFFPSILEDPDLYLQTLELTEDDVDYFMRNIYGNMMVQNAETFLGVLMYKYEWFITLLKDKYNVKFITLRRSPMDSLPSMVDLLTNAWNDLNIKYEHKYAHHPLLSFGDRERLIRKMQEWPGVLNLNFQDWINIATRDEIRGSLESFLNLNRSITPIAKEESHTRGKYWEYWKRENSQRWIRDEMEKTNDNIKCRLGSCQIKSISLFPHSS